MLLKRIENQRHLGVSQIGAIENKAFLDGLERKLIKLVSKPEEIKEVRKLISIGAPVNGLDDEYGDWDTALQLAVLFANTDAVEALIAAGCDVRKINKIGETALQQAKFRSHKEIEKMILETGV